MKPFETGRLDAPSGRVYPPHVDVIATMIMMIRVLREGRDRDQEEVQESGVLRAGR